MAKDRTRHARRREPQPERAQTSLLTSMCEEVIKSILESALDALERAGVECGERAVSDDDQ